MCKTFVDYSKMKLNAKFSFGVWRTDSTELLAMMLSQSLKVNEALPFYCHHSVDHSVARAYPLLDNIVTSSPNLFVYFVVEFDVADVVSVYAASAAFSAVEFVVLLGRVLVLKLVYRIPSRLHLRRVGP